MGCGSSVPEENAAAREAIIEQLAEKRRKAAAEKEAKEKEEADRIEEELKAAKPKTEMEILIANWPTMDPGAVTAALRNSRSNHIATVAGFKRISELLLIYKSTNDPDRVNLRTQGCFELMFDIFIENLASSVIVKAALEGILGVVQTLKDTEKFVGYHAAPKRVVEVMKKHASPDDVETLRVALKVVSRCATIGGSWKIEESDMLEATIVAIKSNAGDLDMCKTGIMAIGQFANYLGKRVGELNMLELVVDVMKAFPDDEDVNMEGCLALQVGCSNGQTANKEKVAVCGGFEYLVNLLNKYSTHKNYIFTKVCDTVKAIADGTDVTFPPALDDPNVGFASSLGSVGACEALCSLLDMHQSKYGKSMNTNIFETLLNLTLSAENRAKMISLGILKTIKSTMEKIGPDQAGDSPPGTATYCCELVRRLCLKENNGAQASFYAIGGCELIVNVMKNALTWITQEPKHRMPCKPMWDAVGALSSLSNECSAKFGTLGVFDAMAGLMKLQPNNSSLFYQASLMIFALITNSDNKIKLREMEYEIVPLLNDATTIKEINSRPKSLLSTPSNSSINTSSQVRVTSSLKKAASDDVVKPDYLIVLNLAIEKIQQIRIDEEAAAAAAAEKKRIEEEERRSRVNIMEKFREFKESSQEMKIPVSLATSSDSEVLSQLIEAYKVQNIELEKERLRAERIQKRQDDKKRVKDGKGILAASFQKWSKIVTDYERKIGTAGGGGGVAIVLSSALQKKSGNLLIYQNRQLILTEKPSLLYADPSKMEIKGEIEWDPKSLPVAVKVDQNEFVVNTSLPKPRVYNFRLLSDTSDANTVDNWVKMINNIASDLKSQKEKEESDDKEDRKDKDAASAFKSSALYACITFLQQAIFKEETKLLLFLNDEKQVVEEKEQKIREEREREAAADKAKREQIEAMMLAYQSYEKSS